MSTALRPGASPSAQLIGALVPPNDGDRTPGGSIGGTSRATAARTREDHDEDQHRDDADPFDTVMASALAMHQTPKPTATDAQSGAHSGARSGAPSGTDATSVDGTGDATGAAAALTDATGTGQGTTPPSGLTPGAGTAATAATTGTTGTTGTTAGTTDPAAPTTPAGTTTTNPATPTTPAGTAPTTALAGGAGPSVTDVSGGAATVPGTTAVDRTAPAGTAEVTTAGTPGTDASTVAHLPERMPLHLQMRAAGIRPAAADASAKAPNGIDGTTAPADTPIPTASIPEATSTSPAVPDADPAAPAWTSTADVANAQASATTAMAPADGGAAPDSGTATGSDSPAATVGTITTNTAMTATAGSTGEPAGDGSDAGQDAPRDPAATRNAAPTPGKGGRARTGQADEALGAVTTATTPDAAVSLPTERHTEDTDVDVTVTPDHRIGTVGPTATRAGSGPDAVSTVMASAPTGPLAPEPPTTPASQVASAVRALHGTDGTHRLTMELRPDDLGAVTIEVTINQGTVHLSMRADRAETGQLLHRSLDELRASLQDGGLTAGQLDVGQRGAGRQNAPFLLPEDRFGDRPLGERHRADAQPDARQGRRTATSTAIDLSL